MQQFFAAASNDVDVGVDLNDFILRGGDGDVGVDAGLKSDSMLDGSPRSVVDTVENSARRKM